MKHKSLTMYSALALLLVLLLALTGTVGADEPVIEPDPMNADPPPVDEDPALAAIISNGTVTMGVHPWGFALDGGYGLTFVPTSNEALWVGCLCEGWGAADAISGVQGWASDHAGVSNLAFVSFTSTASTARSVATVGSTLRVTHDYHPSAATPNLYEIDVTIDNISGASVDMRYSRDMDWDVNPTPFSEFVTIQGTAAEPTVLYADNNGFQNPGPLFGRSSYGATGDFVDFGPIDQGALFDFGFGNVAAGESVSFKIYYGAAGTETGALAAIAAVGANVYSLGQVSYDPVGGTPNTFIFAYSANQPPTANPNGPYVFPLNAGPFDGTGSSDPDGDALTYDWDWGDGSSSPNAGATPSHTYAEAGIYNVCLTVTDTGGLSDTACTNAVVYDPDGGFVTGGGWIDSPEGAMLIVTECAGSIPSVAVAEEPNPDKASQVATSEVTVEAVPIDYTLINGCVPFTDGDGLQGETEWRNIYYPDTHEYYRFYGIAGLPVEIEVHRTTSAMDPAMTLCFGTAADTTGLSGSSCGPDMTFVASADDNNGIPHGVGGWYSDPRIAINLPYTGWYTLKVFDYIGAGPGPTVPFELHYSLPELPTGKANFGFVSKYKKGADTPTGNTEFQFHAADLNFHSSSYEWLLVTGSNYARFKGVGTINGEGEYKFMLWAGDGTGTDGADTFRIRIWTEDEFGVETDVYDNGMDQDIGGGSIVVHTKK